MYMYMYIRTCVTTVKWICWSHLTDQLIMILSPHVTVGCDGEGVSGEGVKGGGGRVHHKAAAPPLPEQS